MLAECVANPNGFSNIQVGACRGRMPLPPKGPSQALYCGPIHTNKQVNMPKSCSTDVLSEDAPPWLDDLLNEPESPNKLHHRRAASDSFAYLPADSNANELWLTNNVGAPGSNFQMAQHFSCVQPPQGLVNSRKPSSECKQQKDKLWKPPSNPASLPHLLINPKEDADCQALGMSCSPEPDRVRCETKNQGAPVTAAASITSENSSGGSDCSTVKPPGGSNCSQVKPSGGSDCSRVKPTSASNTDAKRKQHNARRSRVRKLQYIAELEKNAQALQVAGAEASAQLEFLDQQNLILGMENRALKQRLESLSQEHYIKSMEQEILDKELARLQYLYHLQQNVNHQQRRQQQRQKQNPAAHRRGRSFNDLDSQFPRHNIHPPKPVAASNVALK
ncbi:Basic leucine zipper 61 [Bienertia sinuspersici]